MSYQIPPPVPQRTSALTSVARATITVVEAMVIICLIFADLAAASSRDGLGATIIITGAIIGVLLLHIIFVLERISEK